MDKNEFLNTIPSTTRDKIIKFLTNGRDCARAEKEKSLSLFAYTMDETQRSRFLVAEGEEAAFNKALYFFGVRVEGNNHE